MVATQYNLKYCCHSVYRIDIPGNYSMNTEALLYAYNTEQTIFLSVFIQTLFVKKIILKV